MLHIDKDKALELLKAAVELKGEDYVYKKVNGSCMYVDIPWVWDDEVEHYVYVPEEATHSCLIGVALHLAGIPLAAFTDLFVNEEDASAALYALQEEGLVEFDEIVSRIFMKAQGFQDQGLTWGEALRAAESVS